MSLELIRPTTVAGAIRELRRGDALPLAGGTSVVLLMNTRLLEPERLVSLALIPGLNGVRAIDDVVEIGAMCTHHQLSRHPVLRAHLPGVADMFGRIGNVRVRAWATVGGNLAHADPAQDPPVMLSALEAEVLVEGPRARRSVAVQDLADGMFSTVLDPDELITAIRVPVPTPSERYAYLKFLPRTADDYATVSAAARVKLDTDGSVTAARLVLGSVGPTAVVAEEAAALLVGRPLGDEAALEAMADAVRDSISPGSDSRGSSEYRRQMAGVMAKRAVLACASG